MAKKDRRDFGKHELKELTSLDLRQCNNIGDLLDSLMDTSFGARELGQAWSVLKKVAMDKECAVILTISGAMTIAKLGKVFGTLISQSMVHAVVTTGAVVTHSLVEEIGFKHYHSPEKVTDEQLCRLGLNRIYDSIETESNLRSLEHLVCQSFQTLGAGASYGSYEIVNHLAAELLKGKHRDGLIGSAFERGVDVFVPAFTDSELGLYIFRHNRPSNQFHFDALKDLERFSIWMTGQRRIAFLTIGGGVPRNWAQQMLPFLRSESNISKHDIGGILPKVIAAIRICPDAVSLGHLSGSTYSEGISWGKFDSDITGNLIEVHCDATIAFPLLAKAMIDYLAENG